MTKRILFLLMSIIVAVGGYYLWTSTQTPAGITPQSGGEATVMFFIGIIANVTGVISGLHYFYRLFAG